jgi:hypothetical protein
LAQCKLDIDHPKFVVIGNASDDGLKAGLQDLKNLVAKDHKLSTFFAQPMPKYPEYQNRIWQWDFRPEGETSSTRKGWRLYAYVPDPKAPEPIPAIAFVCWDKKNAPKGDYVQYLAGILEKFLTQTVRIIVAESQFIDRKDSQGRVVSTCDHCWDVIISADEEEAELNKGIHKDNCAGRPPI